MLELLAKIQEELEKTRQLIETLPISKETPPVSDEQADSAA